MLRDKLQNAGISVVSAVNGKEAVGLAMTERPNLIIMDWMMPEMNGIDACKTIRTNPEHAGTPIIMLTAKGQELDEKKGRDAGATYYITKPFSPRRILRLVEECTQPSGGGRA
jgi:DNA-binding response OmpR family regulator